VGGDPCELCVRKLLRSTARLPAYLGVSPVIGLHTPANVHYGHAANIADQRSATLAAARARHPERFATTTDPKILALPEAGWINRPKEDPETEAA
jgi:hypothetical protein